MPKCDHKNLTYLGEQETLDKKRILYLFNCIDCGSTISIPEKDILEVLLKIVKDSGSTISIPEKNILEVLLKIVKKKS